MVSLNRPDDWQSGADMMMAKLKQIVIMLMQMDQKSITVIIPHVLCVQHKS